MTNSNSLVFANLGSGDYTLKIKTITQHGVMSDESSVHFTINHLFGEVIMQYVFI